jgi:hypothetical protein
MEFKTTPRLEFFEADGRVAVVVDNLDYLRCQQLRRAGSLSCSKFIDTVEFEYNFYLQFFRPVFQHCPIAVPTGNMYSKDSGKQFLQIAEKAKVKCIGMQQYLYSIPQQFESHLRW